MKAKLLLAITLICAFCVQTDAHQPQWKPTADSAFEVGTQLRPWTILDEGWDTIFENMKMAGVNNVYLVTIMHQERRPFGGVKQFPHNPGRAEFTAEDSTISFFPDMARYAKIKPALSQYDWIRARNWLQELIDQCRARRLAVGAEISHYPVPKQWLAANPQWCQRHIDGKPNTSRFCPNQPDIRHYVLALYADLAANYDLDYIQTCQYLFYGSGCYCTNCQREARKAGIDVDRVLAALRQDEQAEPHYTQWTDWQRTESTRFYRDISEVIAKVKKNPKCHLRLNDVYTWGGTANRDTWKQGLDLKSIGAYLGSYVNQDHQEQRGRKNEDFALRKAWLQLSRGYIGPDKPLVTSIAARMNAKPELVKRGIKVALESPAQINGVALKHYDGASYGLLRAFKQGLIEAGVQGMTPTLGYEAEAMQLDGYEKTAELADDFGVQTTGTGTASQLFEYPSGTYDVRISYFDARAGQSQVELHIAGKHVASFKLDEDCHCWRWRRFNSIKINKGDRITLKGKAHQQDLACLEHVEFIKP